MVFSGGGSGGHLIPSIAVASEFKKLCPRSELLFLCARAPLDYNILADYNFQGVFSGKLRRYFSLRNFLDFFKFILGIFQSVLILSKFRPDLVFSKGGFVALPVCIAAQLLRIPIVAHESDTYPGLANRIISRFAQLSCYSFPTKNLDKIGAEEDKKFYSGTPIRSEIFSASKERALKFLKFKKNLPVILCMGASQGSLQINKLAVSLAKKYSNKFNFVVITGKGKNLKASFDNLREFELLTAEMPDLLACASIVISRAGANSLFELSALKKAAIIIPHPATGGDHQRKNARVFENAKAAFYLDPSLSDEDLILKSQIIIDRLTKDEQLKKDIEKNIGKLSTRKSAQIIAKRILQFIR